MLLFELALKDIARVNTWKLHRTTPYLALRHSVVDHGAAHGVSWGQNEKIRLFSLGVSSDSDCGQKVYICQPQEVSLGVYCWGTPHSSSCSQLWRREFSLGPITTVTTNHCSVSEMIPPGMGKVLLFSPSQSTGMKLSMAGARSNLCSATALRRPSGA